LNTGRLLKIIGYNPADYIKGDQINIAMGGKVRMINNLKSNFVERISEKASHE
jgi:hypothetical protein